MNEKILSIKIIENNITKIQLKDKEIFFSEKDLNIKFNLNIKKSIQGTLESKKIISDFMFEISNIDKIKKIIKEKIN